MHHSFEQTTGHLRLHVGLWIVRLEFRLCESCNTKVHFTKDVVGVPIWRHFLPCRYNSISQLVVHVNHLKFSLIIEQRGVKTTPNMSRTNVYTVNRLDVHQFCH